MGCRRSGGGWEEEGDHRSGREAEENQLALYKNLDVDVCYISGKVRVAAAAMPSSNVI